jgi:hypothetical protein
MVLLGTAVSGRIADISGRIADGIEFRRSRPRVLPVAERFRVIRAGLSGRFL